MKLLNLFLPRFLPFIKEAKKGTLIIFIRASHTDHAEVDFIKLIQHWKFWDPSLIFEEGAQDYKTKFVIKASDITGVSYKHQPKETIDDKPSSSIKVKAHQPNYK
jgi:hypothetical protein